MSLKTEMSNVLFRCMFLAVIEYLGSGFGPGYSFRAGISKKLLLYLTKWLATKNEAVSF